MLWIEQDHIHNYLQVRDVPYTLNRVTVPHTYNKDNDKSWLLTVYTAYITAFDYNKWWTEQLCPGVKLLKVNDQLKHFIVQYQTDLLSSRINIDSADLLKTLLNELKEIMIPGQEYFMKLSGTSGKNEKSLSPLTSPHDVVKRMLTVKQFYTQEYSSSKDTFIVLVPWNDNINCRNEFRLFIVDKRIVAASPQKWWEDHHYSYQEIRNIELSLLSAGVVLNNITYNDCVADVYIELDKGVLHIIELNPFGAFCGAGSSLFNWNKDYNQLNGFNDYCELRYLSTINV